MPTSWRLREFFSLGCTLKQVVWLLGSVPGPRMFIISMSKTCQFKTWCKGDIVVCASGRVVVQPHSAAGIYVFSGFRAALDLRLC